MFVGKYSKCKTRDMSFLAVATILSYFDTFPNIIHFPFPCIYHYHKCIIWDHYICDMSGFYNEFTCKSTYSPWMIYFQSDIISFIVNNWSFPLLLKQCPRSKVILMLLQLQKYHWWSRLWWNSVQAMVLNFISTYDNNQNSFGLVYL